jgi:hypothetical protein
MSPFTRVVRDEQPVALVDLPGKALPAFVWVEIESSTVEVDGRLEVLRVAEAARRLLDPLDDGVDPSSRALVMRCRR